MSPVLCRLQVLIFSQLLQIPFSEEFREFSILGISLAILLIDSDGSAHENSSQKIIGFV